MRKHLVFLILLLCSLTAISQTEPEKSGLWLNNVPAVIDETAGRIYFTLRKEQPYNLTATLRWDETVYNAVTLNGNALTNGAADNFTVADWHERYANKLTIDGKEWTLAFTNLPIVWIGAAQKDICVGYKHQEISSTLTVIDANCRNFVNLPDDTPSEKSCTFSTAISIDARGATSIGLNKKSFKIELKDEQGEERNAHILGYRSDGDWILDAMCNDVARMRNRLVTDIWNTIQDLPYAKDNEYQKNGTDGEFVELFMKGQWHGLYCLTDKIDRKKLNLKKTQEATETTEEQTRGMLWKSKMSSSATTFSKWTQDPLPGCLVWELDYKDRATWKQKYPKDREDQGDFRPLADFITVVGMSDDQTLMNQLEDFVYIDNVIDYLIVFNAFAARDNQQKNMYLSVRNINKDKKLLFTPWDMDCTFGRNDGSDPSLTNDWLAFGSQMGQNRLFNKMAKDKNVTKWHKQIIDRWAELKAGELSPENVKARIKAYADLFANSGAWARELERWRTGPDSIKAHHIAKDIYDEVKFMSDFIDLNYQYFDAHIATLKGETPPPINPGDQGGDNDKPLGQADGIKPVTISDTPLPQAFGNAVKVVTLDGTAIVCPFADKPVITFNDVAMLLHSEMSDYSWYIDNVDYWSFLNLGEDTAINAFTIDGNGEKRFFTTDGVEVDPANIPAGVYIMKAGKSTVKLIKK